MAPVDGEQQPPHPEEGAPGPGDDEDWGDDDSWHESPPPEAAFYIALKGLVEVKKLLDRGAPIPREMLQSLATPEELPDSEQLIPLDLRLLCIKLQRRCVDETTGLLDVPMLIQELGIQEAAQFLIDAATRFFHNPYRIPDAERQPALTAREWREMWDMDGGWGDEEGMEEEAREGDEEVPFEDHPDNEDDEGYGYGYGHGYGYGYGCGNHSGDDHGRRRGRQGGPHSNRGEYDEGNNVPPGQGPNACSGSVNERKIGNVPISRSTMNCSNIPSSNLPTRVTNADCSNYVNVFFPTAKLNASHSERNRNGNSNVYMANASSNFGATPQSAANQNSNVNCEVLPFHAVPSSPFGNNVNAEVQVQVQMNSPNSLNSHSNPIAMPSSLVSPLPSGPSPIGPEAPSGPSPSPNQSGGHGGPHPEMDLSETETEAETGREAPEEPRDRSRSPHGGAGAGAGTGGGGRAKPRHR